VRGEPASWGCEQQISWAYEWCKSLEGKDRDTCAITIIVQNLGDITGEFNLTKLHLDGDCFRIGQECPAAAQNTTTTQNPQIDTQTVERVIRHCVEVVHQSAKTDPVYKTPDLSTWGFAQFDAFFNAGTGRVENNGGNPQAIYAFNKCMAASGVPLR